MTKPLAIHRRAALTSAALVLALLWLPGCGMGDPMLSKAESVYEETMQADPRYAFYAMSLARQYDNPSSKQLLVRGIASEDYETVREAVDAVVDSPPAEAEEALRAVYDGRSGVLKLKAGIALARLGDTAALDWVAEQVGASANSLTVGAAKLLAENGKEDQLTPILEKWMANDDVSIRNEAYTMLGEIRQPWATALLLEGLEKEFGEERQQAILSLGQTGDPEVAGKIETFVNTKGLVFASIEALGALGNERSVAPLQGMAKSDSALVRVYAGSALLRLGDEATALEVLGPLVEDEDVNVRQNLAEQLAHAGGGPGAEILAALAKDENADVRLAAVRSLGKQDAAPAAPFLEALEDASYEIKTSALDALARIGGEDSLERVAPLLEDQNPYVKLSAANAIVVIKERSAPVAA
jgi:HEAT repeat protein